MSEDHTSSEDRRLVQWKQSVNVCVKRIKQLQDGIDRSKTGIESSMVALVNALREQGLLLQEITGHQAIAERDAEVWERVQGELPFDLIAAKKRMALARKLPEPVKTFEDARVVYRSVCEQVELLRVTEGEGNPGKVQDQFTHCLNTFSLLKQKWQKVLVAYPLEQSSPQRMKTFLADTEWIVEARAAAQRMLQHGTQT